ncbi:hypothetical protein MYX07_00300 [Patescibacteria group bacterium AH-259-L07]|nr:hypothetical protein [Patescibacteria group bacterium AH-259-L07]
MKSSYELVKEFYKDDKGKPFLMTSGQVKIFDAIAKREKPRIQVETYTQYGKTDVISMAVLTRASTYPEKWAIIAPTKKKAGIMMGDVIKHIFENQYTRSKFRIDPGESEERIKRERSKERITFKVGKNLMGEIFILSAESRRKGEDAGDALLGFGSPNLIEDESALIPDKIHSKAMRMLGGHKDNFLCKVGNPFRRNHFLKSFQSQRYYKMIIDYVQGIKEGRIKEEFVEEMRKEAFFGVLYEVKFPEQGEIDDQGWYSLLVDTQVETAFAVDDKKRRTKKRLGIDPARGGDLNAYVIRDDFTMRVKHTDREADTMGIVGKTIHFIEEEKIHPSNVFIGTQGLGWGAYDRLIERGFKVNAVVEGEKSKDMINEKKRYFNIKAELYWKMRKWILAGGKLDRHDDWYQLCDIKYKEDSSSVIKMMSKEEMRRRGIESPDVPDAGMFTFAAPVVTEKKDAVQSGGVEEYYPGMGV